MNKEQYYNYSHIDQVDFVSFDIETTGLLDTDIITTFTLFHENTYQVWLNLNGDTVEKEEIQQKVIDTSELDVRIHPQNTEQELINSIRKYISDEIELRTTILTAYNGETWKGGFDISFIRSRCLSNTVEFPFKDVAYTDIMPIFSKKDRFNLSHISTNPNLNKLLNKDEVKEFIDYLGLDCNTSTTKKNMLSQIKQNGYTDKEVEEFCENKNLEYPTENPKDLVGVFKRVSKLCDWNSKDIDPFGPTESEKAVSAYNNGEYIQLILHNLADVHKTQRLINMIVNSQSIPKKEYEPTFY